ncbi:hypothetical protein NL676_034555 [Syzygium grande]|nr:hypothetical protein NL676_034555 [Syzygium grande]
MEGLLAGTLMIFSRRAWGYLFSTEEVVNYVGDMLALQEDVDGKRLELSSIWVPAIFLGIPVAIFVAFLCHIGGKGLWTRIIVALFAQALLLAVLTGCTDWKKEAKKATDRVHSAGSRAAGLLSKSYGGEILPLESDGRLQTLRFLVLKPSAN